MRKEDPHVTFDLATLHSDEVSAAMIEKRFDMCIGFEDEFDERLRCRIINTVDLMVLAAPGLLPAPDGALDPAMLDGMEMIGLRDSGPVADRIYEYLEEIEIEPHVAISAQTYYIAAELAKLGAGVALVDGFTARRFAGEDLIAYRLAGAPTLPFVCITLADAEDSPLVQSAYSVLTDHFA